MLYITSKIQNQKDIKSVEILKVSNYHIDLNLELYDNLIITSKNATFPIKDIAKLPKIFTFSKSANKILQNRATLVEARNVKDFIEQAYFELKNQRNLYLRGKEISYDIKSFLNSKNIELDESVVYETTIDSDSAELLKPAKYIAVTSPKIMNFIMNNLEFDKYIFIAIGETTAKKFIGNHDKIYVAEDASINSCIELYRNIIEKENNH